MQPVPNHPYAHWEAGPDRFGRYFIRCYCSFCGQRAEKQCARPHLTSARVFEFATLHGHGLRPQVLR